MKRLRNTPLAGLAGLSLTALLFSACGGGDEDSAPTATPTAGDVSAQIVTSDLVVGENRFSVGIIDEDRGVPVLDARNVRFRFFRVLPGDQAELRAEAEAETVRFETSYINEATGQTVVTGEIAVYVAAVEFTEAGDWGVEITATVGDKDIDPIRLAFTVLERGATLNVGDPAPRSRQTIAADVADISEIESMLPADPFHDTTIADAIAAGKPVVVLFGTPAFCETRICAPVMNTVMLPLYEKYPDQVTFIHIEPYLLDEAREGKGFCAVPVFNREFAAQGIGEGTSECPAIPPDQLPPPEESWNLAVEPIIFVIDRQGVIAGKFESVVGANEVEESLQEALAQT